MDDALKILGLEHRRPEMRDYWFDEMKGIDIDPDRLKFTDIEGNDVVIPFKQCHKTWCEINILGESPTVKSQIVGVRVGFASPPYILFLSNPPIRIIFRTAPRNDDQENVNQLFDLGDEFYQLWITVVKAGWGTFDFG